MNKFIYITFILLAFLLPQTNAAAQTISLDSTFNQQGYTALDLIHSFEPLNMVLQPDGKILVSGAGKDFLGAFYDGTLFRLNADGTLDDSFGNGGVLLLDVDGGHDQINGIAILPDNKILVLLESAYRTILIRLHPDGDRDLTFGNDGFSFVPTGTFEYTDAMQVQADGKILILSDMGPSGGHRFGTVRRCNPDGSLDTAYGINGSVKIDIDPSKNFTLLKGALQADGKLLITGQFGYNTTSGFPAVRLNTDGSFDNTFSGDGIFVKVLGNEFNSAQAECIAVNAAGNIFIAGRAPYLSDIPMTIVSLKPNGSTNGAFANFGDAKISFTVAASARKIIFQPDGKIIVAGYSFLNYPTTIKMVLVRLNANGSPDPSFGDATGRFSVSLNEPYDVQIINDMLLQPNGRLLGAGSFRKTADYNNTSVPSAGYMLRFMTGLTVKASTPSLVFKNTAVSPNPVRDEELQLTFNLENPGKVSVRLYQESGQELQVLVPATALSEGEQQLRFHLPAGLAGGVYFLVLERGEEVKVLRVVVAR